MPVVDITTRGTEKLARLAKAISDAGAKDLQRELTKAIKKAERPMLRAAKQGAIQILPYRGGLAERVASSRFSTAVNVSGRGVSVRIVGVSRHRDQLDRMDERGIVRHPVHADPDAPRGQWTWVTQYITPGWFSKPLILEAQKTSHDVSDAVDKVAHDLEAKGG